MQHGPRARANQPGRLVVVKQLQRWSGVQQQYLPSELKARVSVVAESGHVNTEQKLTIAAFASAASRFARSASSRAFCSCSSRMRSISPLRMYLFGRGGPSSRALRFANISALRASMMSRSRLNESRMNKSLDGRWHAGRS